MNEAQRADWCARRPHLPVPILDGALTSTDMRTLTSRSLWCTSTGGDMWHPGQEELCGFFIPPFQRDRVWDEGRQRAFVESAYMGISLGTIIYNDAFNSGEHRASTSYHRTDRWLLDGQQRLTALMHYVEGGMAVFTGMPCEHRWADLNEIERRTFWSIQMGVMATRSTDENKLRMVYDRVNFGGVPHEEHQRALPLPAAA